VVEEARQEEHDRLANAAKWLVLILFLFLFFLALCTRQNEREHLAKAARLHFFPCCRLLCVWQEERERLTNASKLLFFVWFAFSFFCGPGLLSSPSWCMSVAYVPS
jgi:hypothetical protein